MERRVIPIPKPLCTAPRSSPLLLTVSESFQIPPTLAARCRGRVFSGCCFNPGKDVIAPCVWSWGLCCSRGLTRVPLAHSSPGETSPRLPNTGESIPAPWAGSQECEREAPFVGQSLFKHPLAYYSKKSENQGGLSNSQPSLFHQKSLTYSFPRVNGNEFHRRLKKGVGVVCPPG